MQSNVEKIKQWLSLRPSYSVLMWYRDGGCAAISRGPSRPVRFYDLRTINGEVVAYKLRSRTSRLERPVLQSSI